jgi:hypothetical protein
MMKEPEKETPEDRAERFNEIRSRGLCSYENNLNFQCGLPAGHDGVHQVLLEKPEGY